MEGFVDKTLDDVMSIVNDCCNKLYERFGDSIRIKEIKFDNEFDFTVNNKGFVLTSISTSTGGCIKISGKKRKKKKVE